MADSLWKASEAQRARIEQNNQNSGRLARHAVTHTTHGYGDLMLESPAMFDCTFIAEPSISTGCYVEGSLKKGNFPRISSGVYDWVMDDAGMYRGAYLWVSITLPPGATGVTAPLYTIHHHWVFQTIALKQLPDHVINDSPTARGMGAL